MIKTIISCITISMCLIGGYTASYELEYPSTWPEPVYPLKTKPLSQNKIELGRLLFYDPILSANNTISCANCHLSYTAFTHVDHALSHGIRDSIGTRNSPALINLAWNKHFMWDGAINNLEVQALAPISHPAEMGESIEHVLEKLQKHPRYPALFKLVYDDSIISSKNMLIALAQFQLTFVSSNSRYDKMVAGEINFNEQERRGYSLFQAQCNSCHTEPLFTNGNFANNGLPLDSLLLDVGRYKVTKIPSDSFQFKVPTLRNIEYSQPYMHDGRFSSLNHVLAHYTSGIDSSSNTTSDIRNNLKLSTNDQIDLIAFLLTLSDKEFLFNPNLAYPRKNFFENEGVSDYNRLNNK